MDEASSNPSTSQRASREYGELFDRVSAILFEFDPIGIGFEGNTDEYDAEAGTILPRLKACHGVEDASRVVYEEFVRWFDEEIAGDPGHYKLIGDAIWSVWETSQARRDAG